MSLHPTETSLPPASPSGADRVIQSYLAESDWDAAVRRIEHDRLHAPPHVGRERRAGGRRHAALVNCLLRYTRNDNTPGIALVRTRNVSAGGVSVVHGEALPAGTVCQLAIEATQGQGVVTHATVVRSREIDDAELSQAGFEIGLTFAEPIDVSGFTSED